MESATQRKSSRKHVPSQRLLEAQDSSSLSSRTNKRRREVEVEDLPPASRRRSDTQTPEDDEDEIMEVEDGSSSHIEEVVEEVREPEGNKDDVGADQSEASLRGRMRKPS